MVITYSDEKCEDRINGEKEWNENLKYMRKFINKCTKTGEDEWLAFSCSDKAMTATIYTDDACKKEKMVNDETAYQKKFEWESCTKWDEATYLKVIGKPLEEAILI